LLVTLLTSEEQRQVNRFSTQSIAIEGFYWGGFNFSTECRLDSVAGHAWTVAPPLMESVLPFQRGCGKPFTTTVQDSVMGTVKLTGILDDTGSDSLVLIIHGHGSNANSRSCADMARAARKAGLASLRLSQRGADLSGEDIYHGGLTDDLHAALQAPELLKYKRIFVAGYSVGGQIAMRSVIDHIDNRIRCVAAVC
jgi:predicted alpha/beta-fold hydrolase